MEPEYSSMEIFHSARVALPYGLDACYPGCNAKQQILNTHWSKPEFLERNFGFFHCKLKSSSVGENYSILVQS